MIKQVTFTDFYRPQHSLLYAERCTAIVNPSVCPSVCLSVRHTQVLCQNDSSYCNCMIMQSSQEDSPRL